MYDPTKWTRKFVIGDDSEADMKAILLDVYRALREKGYNPVNQLVGYILSEDPTYITTHKDARKLIRRIDRDELLNALVSNYIRNITDSKD